MVVSLDILTRMRYIPDPKKKASVTVEEKMELKVSGALANLIRKAKALMSAERYVEFFLKISRDLERAVKEVEALPRGATRAKIVHSRAQAAIDTHFPKNPRDKKAVSCFGCTQSGCCHTNVDVTESEAVLLADLVESGAVKVDRDLLKLQAGISDEKEGKVGIRAWEKLSFENRRCVFLTAEGKCGVYEDRPSVCRKWFVTDDPKYCADYSHEGGVLIVKVAEIIANAAFLTDESGRLPKMLLAELERRDRN